jgi:hypothetical protein
VLDAAERVRDRVARSLLHADDVPDSSSRDGDLVTWINLDDGILEHPKFIRAVNMAGPGVVFLWLGLRAYCAKHLTDGVVPADMLGEVRGPKSWKERGQCLRVLEEVGLIHRPDPAGPVEMHDYLDWAPSRDEVLNKRASARERQAKSRGMSQRDSALSHDEPTEQSQPPNPKPKPNQSKPKAEFAPASADATEAKVVVLAPAEHSDTAKLQDHYARAFQAAKGVPHKLAKGQGGRYGKAAKELVSAVGLPEACAIVDRALADQWQRDHRPELWELAADMNKFRGSAAAPAGRHGAAPGQNFALLNARIQRMEREEAEREAH